MTAYENLCVKYQHVNSTDTVKGLCSVFFFSSSVDEK
uniref:Uncharacterized protein n=1 Tax=Anguilla anguilla TaxID=7936 RepID=A0A0E9Q3T1_ANGAN